MSLQAIKKPSNSLPPLNGASYSAVCIAVVDLGEQYTQFDKQKQGKYVPQCMFIFEIPDERVDVDGESKPRWVSTKRLTVSLHERSALCKLLTSWRGCKLNENQLENGFDLSEMLGEGAILAISLEEKEDGNKVNRIESITGLPKGIPTPKPESELLAFDADEPDFTVLDKLPAWVQDIIKKSTQFAQNPPAESITPPEQTINKQPSITDAGEECPI